MPRYADVGSAVGRSDGLPRFTRARNCKPSLNLGPWISSQSLGLVIGGCGSFIKMLSNSELTAPVFVGLEVNRVRWFYEYARFLADSYFSQDLLCEFQRPPASKQRSTSSKNMHPDKARAITKQVARCSQLPMLHRHSLQNSKPKQSLKPLLPPVP